MKGFLCDCKIKAGTRLSGGGERSRQWDQWYASFSDRRIIVSGEKREKLFSLPGHIESMLDIGCGQGDYVRSWANRRIFSVGADISSVAIQQAIDLTPPELSDFCQWYTLDWETADIKGKGWYKKFDFVFSSMGPDMAKGNSLEKMLSVSKRYCRLIVFKEGKNDVITRVRRFLEKAEPETETERKEEHLLKKIIELGYEPQTDYISFTAEWEQSIEEWQKYLNTVYYPQKSSAEIQRVLKQAFGARDFLHSVTSSCYAMITWEIY